MKFWGFVIGLVITFGLPWFFLIVFPTMWMNGIEPLPYYEKADNGDPLLDGDGKMKVVGYYPPALSGNQKQGLKIYFELGCAQCHTQMIRATYAGSDSFKKVWGTGKGGEGVAYLRQTTPYDYLGEDHAAIGLRRYGPDLSNYGHRMTDEKLLHKLLCAPYAVSPGTSMPSYRHLYKVRRISGQPSVDAVDLEGTPDAPEEGYEVVPGDDAKALVSYLRSLKKDYPLPYDIRPAGDKSASGAEEQK